MSDVSKLTDTFVVVESKTYLQRLSWRGSQPLRLAMFTLARVLTDIVAIVAASVASTKIYHLLFLSLETYRDENIAIGIVGGILFAAIAHGRELYSDDKGQSISRRIPLIVIVWLVVFSALTVFGFLMKLSSLLSRGSLIMFFFSGLALIIPIHLFWSRLFERFRAVGLLAPMSVALLAIGSEETAAAIASRMRNAGQHLVKIWRIKLLRANAGAEDISRFVLEQLQSEPFTELLIAAPAGQMQYVQKLSESLRLAPVRVCLLLDDRMKWVVAQPSRIYGHDTAVELSRAPLGVFERLIKRSFDIVASAGALFLLSPFLVLVAVAIRLDSPGPVLFRQRRDGFNNQPFRIFKFRSMRVTEDGPSIRQASRRDDRVTRVGRFIRRTSIDELPQIWNVLRGEMSIVGPRPHAVAHGEYYSNLIAEYAHRHHVKPGLTGWAQVNGNRGETKTVDKMRERVDLDIWYVDNWSIWLDLKIIFRTIKTIISENNAY